MNRQQYVDFHKIGIDKNTVNIGGTVIERVGDDMPEQAVKFLGIHIDEHLTWNAHIKHVKSKISKSLFSIKQ